MNIKDACRIALQSRQGYVIVSASEIESGWLFGFATEQGDSPDESPLFVSKIDGSVQTYTFEEHIMEIVNAEPIPLSDLEI